jgi:ubiquinone/menaquinone biosynthesis C-methylase UbiE
MAALLAFWAALFSLLDASPAAALDDAARDALLEPERVMDTIGIRSGMVVGEAGAGRGYFTLKLARRVGEAGRIYANDIDERALEHVRERCRSEGIRNVETVVGQVDDPRFPERGLDVVMMVYAIHDFARPAAFLRNLKPYLKPGGTVVILDQNPEASGDTHFFTRARLVELFGQSGYELVLEGDFLTRDLLLVFRPSRS